VVTGSCLSGDVAFEIDGPLRFMSHCHCSRCRKAHGAAFGTYAMAREGDFRFERGRDRVRQFETPPSFSRPFCGRCGSVVPDGVAFNGLVGIPAGTLDGDPGVRPAAHIFVASKAPWFEPGGDLPRFDAYPPGIDSPVLPDRAPQDPPGKPRGSCLCGGVGWVVEGELLRAWACHCSRCRKARATTHGANLFTTADGLRWTRGEALLESFRIPEALRFTQVFCRACGSPAPRVDRERDLAVVPMGGLDDDPGIRLQRHIFAASKAPWYEIPPGIPQDAEYPA
jgi:hypothetical protein